ncbi:nucleotidyltransferase family protein [Methanolobus sp. ZRKC3]|uniref:nucleotidyltransferase family protein n=1 Tax=Methanolobus sp. ZRKC3 TaxID=3125786 RepID=UPI00324DF485
MPSKRDIEINNAFDLVQSLGFDRNKGKELLELCRQNDISSLGLFGSFSRGEQTEESDLDLLVTFSKGKSLIDHIKIEENFESLLGKNVDLITENSLSPYIAPMVKKDLRSLL